MSDYEGFQPDKSEVWEFKTQAKRDQAVRELTAKGFDVTVGSTLTIADPGSQQLDIKAIVKRVDAGATRMRHDT